MHSDLENPAVRHGDYVVSTFDQYLARTDLRFEEPRVLASQIARAVKGVAADEAILLHRRVGQPLASVPLEGIVDLHKDRAEQFIIGDDDRLYFFFLNSERNDWGWPQLKASVALALAGADKNDELVLERVDLPDRVFTPDEVIDLTAVGVERLVTRRRREKVTVFFNDLPILIRPGDYTTEALIATFPIEAGYALDQVLDGNHFDPLRPGHTIRVVAGLHFASIPPGGHSS